MDTPDDYLSDQQGGTLRRAAQTYVGPEGE